MLFRAEKRILFDYLIEHAVGEDKYSEVLAENFPAIPAHLVKRWKHVFYDAPELAFSPTPRLANRFMLGADPEMLFKLPGQVDVYGEPAGPRALLNAESVGLTTGEAFGCDMNGRLVELRAHPSRSALRVVASLMDAMRWMAARHPGVLKASWEANALFKADGVGGHVHFGRKRRNITNEVNSLDQWTVETYRMPVLDLEGAMGRLQAGHYGGWSDVRKQEHGYEYRTIPTWLDSPYSAFFILTLAKLAILYPHPFSGLTPRLTFSFAQSKVSKQRIENLLLRFSEEDDDARLLYRSIQLYGWPIYLGGCIQSRWGVSKVDPIADAGSFYIPTTIPPNEQTVQECFAFFSERVAIPKRAPLPPVWRPSRLLPGTYKVVCNAHCPGLPEISNGLVSRSILVTVTANQDHHGIRIEGCNVNLDFKAIKAYAREHLPGYPISGSVGIRPDEHPSLIVGMPKMGYNPPPKVSLLKQLRTFLVDSGFFPVCRAEHSVAFDASRFRQLKEAVPPKLKGKVLCEVKREKLLAEIAPDHVFQAKKKMLLDPVRRLI